jgi:hypothetical protein
LVLAFAFSLLSFCFKRFFLASFSSQVEEKKNKEKKNHREKQNVKKRGNFPSSSHSTLSLLAPTLPSHFCPSVSNDLCWHPLFLKKKKKKKNKKKNHRKKKKCKERKELTFKLLLCPFIFGFCFWLPTSAF